MQIEQIPSPHFYGRDGYGVLQIVIHTMEAPKKPTTAEWCGRYFQGKVEASAHYMLDDTNVVQGVQEDKGAWACPYFNRSGIQIEHAGYAAQSAADWADPFNTRMLDLSAQLSAQIAARYGIPVHRLSLDEVRKGTIKGFLGHGDATRAGVGGNTHTDPGDAFPWSRYLGLVLNYLGGGTGTGVHPPSQPQPPTAPPSKPPVVAVDGSLGPKTIRAWQKVMGTPVDGVISTPRSSLTAAVQEWLNAHGYRDASGHVLVVDGQGLGSNVGHDFPATGRTRTIEALQRAHHTSVDGRLTADDSQVVRSVQRDLNN